MRRVMVILMNCLHAKPAILAFSNMLGVTMLDFNIKKVFSNNAADRFSSKSLSSVQKITQLLLVVGILQALLYSGYAHAIDAPENIRLEQNRLLWDEVDGISKYDIYLLNVDHPNANGTYLESVEGVNEYVLSASGVYTVVTASPDGEFSALHSGARVVYDTGVSRDTSITLDAVDSPSNIRLEGNLLRWDAVTGISKYDIYLLNLVGPNANGTYLTTVVNANEYMLSTTGIYTVVSASLNGEYSSLHNSDRVIFDTVSNIGAIDSPSNIRIEENLLRWDTVAGVSKYDIYLLSSTSLNANGTYLTTVVDANEYMLISAGIYTVVSASPNGEYSALHTGERAEFDF